MDKKIVKSISEGIKRIELASNLLKQDLLTEEEYQNLVHNQKVEIKDALAYTYECLKLDEVEGNIDYIFESKTEAKAKEILNEALEGLMVLGGVKNKYADKIADDIRSLYYPNEY